MIQKSNTRIRQKSYKRITCISFPTQALSIPLFFILAFLSELKVCAEDEVGTAASRARSVIQEVSLRDISAFDFGLKSLQSF